MPRGYDDKSGRPPGRRGPARGKGGPPRGDGPRGSGGARGGGYKARPNGKRFGGDKSSERTFGEKRRFDARPGSGFRKEGDRPARTRFDRDERPSRGPAREGGDRPRGPRSASAPRSDSRVRDDRGPRKSFGPREDRGNDRPWQKKPSFRHDDAPREDRRARGEGQDRRPRGDRPYRDKPAGDRPYRDRPAGDRPYRSKPRDGDREAARGSDRPRGDRPFRDKPAGGPPFRDKPPGDRPYRGKPRDGDRDVARGSDRPRFSRDRNDRDTGDSRPARPRNDRVSRGSHAWREHPRSEDGFRPRDDRRAERADEQQHGDFQKREFQKRPAFGGRGAYRERKPETGRDFRKRGDAPPAQPKKSGERIAKLIARAGLCSRREAEDWIRDGRVVVNGRVIDSPALDVNERDIVAVDGVPLPERERTRLFLYHKPRGLVTTHADPEGRSTIFENLPSGLPRLISVGRLDYNTEGLLLLTNDGGLKRVLELPDTGWLRRYRVRAHGAITQARLDGLRDGIEVEGVKYGPIEATLDQEQGANVWITFAIREGKNREVRNVLSHLGLEVNRLIRVSYGPFQLAELAEGQVEEVRGRTLRDQLGERIAREAGADFKLPLRQYSEAQDENESRAGGAARERGRATDQREDRRAEKKAPRSRAGLIADGKGRRILVQRIGGEEREDRRGPRRPLRPYKGKRDPRPRKD